MWVVLDNCNSESLNDVGGCLIELDPGTEFR
jgi:hypothetical protein